MFRVYRILSVSHDPLVSDWQQSLLESSGYTVLSVANAAAATPLIHAANIHGILLGSAVRLLDRNLLALHGVSSGIPVICTCGLLPDGECPVVHVPPDEPAQLLAAFAGILDTSAMAQSHEPPTRVAVT